MNPRWIILDYVDPELKLSREQRRLVRQRARLLMWRTPARINLGSNILILLMVALLPAALTCIPLFLLMRLGDPAVLWWGVPSVFVFEWLVMAWIGRWTWRPSVILAIRERGHDLCVKCGYWLRGLGDDVKRCPECGALREPMPRDAAGGTP
jgi:hypothetical protein